MKRPTPESRLRHKRIAALRERCRTKNRPSKKTKPTTKTKANRPKEIFAPKNISLTGIDNHIIMTQFLRSLRREATRNNRVTINFKRTCLTHSCGTLLLLSELDRLTRAMNGFCAIGCTYPNDEKVEKVFQQIGLLKLLEKEHRLEVTEADRDVFHWRFATGIEVDPIPADPILKAIKEQIPRTFRKVVVGVEEAMDNSVHHAYISSRNDRLAGRPGADERRWWLFAEVLDDWLHVNFCDLGIGIPQSLPISWREEATDLVRMALSRGKKDVRMIKRAFEVGRTRTELVHRGKGLKNIANAARDLKGVLTVHSNGGSVRYDYRGDSERVIEMSHKRSIMGTVVQWSIPLSAA